jgi:hypothetical protein
MSARVTPGAAIEAVQQARHRAATRQAPDGKTRTRAATTTRRVTGLTGCDGLACKVYLEMLMIAATVNR